MSLCTRNQTYDGRSRFITSVLSNRVLVLRHVDRNGVVTDRHHNPRPPGRRVVLHMMRELDTVSPVVWPAWCYTGTVHVNIRSLNTIMSACLVFSFLAGTVVSVGQMGMGMHQLKWERME